MSCLRSSITLLIRLRRHYIRLRCHHRFNRMPITMGTWDTRRRGHIQIETTATHTASNLLVKAKARLVPCPTPALIIITITIIIISSSSTNRPHIITIVLTTAEVGTRKEADEASSPDYCSHLIPCVATLPQAANHADHPLAILRSLYSTDS